MTSGPPAPDDAVEEALNLYLDGELPAAEQAPLFAHLAKDAAARRTFEALIAFRRMSRQEHLAVPLAVDAAFLERLGQQKRVLGRVDRAADRQPLWYARAPVSLWAVLVAGVLLFLGGLFVSVRADRAEHAAASGVEGIEELVESEAPASPVQEAVYVFYPGLTVEAQKSEKPPETL